jgi:hypothetical protein
VPAARSSSSRWSRSGSPAVLGSSAVTPVAYPGRAHRRRRDRQQGGGVSVAFR